VPGKYSDQIEAAIQKAHTNPNHLLDTLFYCIGRSNGDIEVIKDCGPGRCADAGSGKSDICLPASQIHLILEMEHSFTMKKGGRSMCGNSIRTRNCQYQF
jgi:hypothetical protein